MSDRDTDAKAETALLSELDFLFEAGHLKKLRRSGWQLIGLRNGESVAEHVFRTAIVGFVLACLEGADPYRVSTICLLHDIQEARVSDLNPVTKRYFDQDKAESAAQDELCKALDDRVSSHLKGVFSQYADGTSVEAVLARDADLLECVLQAYEYREIGIQGADNFVSGASDLRSQLKSKSAVRLAELAATRSSSDWWKLLTQS